MTTTYSELGPDDLNLVWLIECQRCTSQAIADFGDNPDEDNEAARRSMDALGWVIQITEENGPHIDRSGNHTQIVGGPYTRRRILCPACAPQGPATSATG